MPERTNGAVFAPLRRPEIEEIAEFNKVLNNPYHFSSDTTIEICESYGSQQTWMSYTKDRSFDSVPSLLQPSEEGFKTRVYFLNFLQSSTPEQLLQLHITGTAFRNLVNEIAMPMTFVEGMFQHQIWDGSGCFVRRNADSGRVERIGTSFPWHCPSSVKTCIKTAEYN